MLLTWLSRESPCTTTTLRGALKGVLLGALERLLSRWRRRPINAELS